MDGSATLHRTSRWTDRVMVPVGRVGTAYRAARARLPAPRTVYRDLLVLAGAVGLLWFV